MLKQANIINSWSKNIYVKIPVVNSKGLFSGKVINVLSKKGVKLNITAVYTVSQVKKILKNIKKLIFFGLAPERLITTRRPNSVDVQ